MLISGDGAFLSGGLSIEAAFQENCPITVVIDNNGGLDCISQQQERLFKSGSHYATDFRDIPYHTMFEGLGGYGELVTRREEIIPAIRRALESGKTACVNVKAKGLSARLCLPPRQNVTKRQSNRLRGKGRSWRYYLRIFERRRWKSRRRCCREACAYR